MSEQELRRSARTAYRNATPPAPRFEDVWNRAEAQAYRRTRSRRVVIGLAAGVAAAAVGLAFLVRQEPAETMSFTIAESLLESTRWVAPSDVLMPTYPAALYETVPPLFLSTESLEESML